MFLVCEKVQYMSECCKTSVLKFKLLMVHNMFAIQKCKDYDIQNYNFAVVLYGCETWSLKLAEGIAE